MKTEIFSMKSIRLLLIILFVIQGMIFAGMYPLWEGWDEPAHFAYVQHIVEKKTIPKLTDEISNEVAYTLDKVPLNPLLVPPGKSFQDFWNNFTVNELLENKNKLSELDNSERFNTSPWINWEAKQPPFAYLTQSPIYLLFYNYSILERAFALRAFSVIVTAIGIVFAYKTISLLFDDRFIRVGSLMFIVFNPMFTTNITRVNNEFMTILLFSAFLYLMVRYLKEKTNTLHVVLIGLVLGLGLLTKQTFLIAIVLVPFFIFLKHLQNENKQKPVKLLKSLKNLGIIFGITIPMVSWWYYDVIASGNFSGITELRALTVGEYVQGALAISWDRFSEFFFKSFWGLYGWSFYFPPFPYNELIILFTGISIAGLVYGIIKQSKKHGPHLFRFWKYQSILLISFSILLMIIAQIIISIQSYFGLDYKAGLFLGWYLFMTITPTSMLVLLGFRTLIINSKLKRFQNESLFVALVILVIFNTTTLYWLIPKYYVGV